jgi:hypothetical protein
VARPGPKGPDHCRVRRARLSRSDGAWSRGLLSSRPCVLAQTHRGRHSCRPRPRVNGEARARAKVGRPLGCLDASGRVRELRGGVGWSSEGKRFEYRPCSRGNPGRANGLAEGSRLRSGGSRRNERPRLFASQGDREVDWVGPQKGQARPAERESIVVGGSRQPRLESGDSFQGSDSSDRRGRNRGRGSRKKPAVTSSRASRSARRRTTAREQAAPRGVRELQRSQRSL